VNQTSIGLIGLLVLVGCRPTQDQSHRPGQLEVQWTGPSTGRIAGPATAEWCAGHRFLEIRTIEGDSGVALVLYPAKALGAGHYPIVEPPEAASTPPSAGLALRWLAQTAVQGLRGDSGGVDLERSPAGQLSGRLKARARSVVDTLRVTLTGAFQNLTVDSGARECAASSDQPDEAAEAADTGLH
jgi:hypothetical protein